MKNILEKKTVLYFYIISLIVLFILGFIYMSIISTISINFFIHSLILVVPYLLAIYFLYIHDTEKNRETIPEFFLNMPNLEKKLIFLFGIGFVGTIIYLNIVTEKDIFYVIFLTFLYLIIFLQINLTQTNSKIILAEMMLTLANCIFSLTLRHPYYFAQIDIFHHVDWATIMYLSGRLLPTDLLGISYIYYPIFHLVIVIGTNLMNVPVLTSYFIMTGLIFTLSVLLLFIIFRCFANKKIALLACLLYSTTNAVILCGIFMLPYCMAYIFFLVFFFLLLKINTQNSKKPILIAILIPIIIALVYLHHGSLFQILGLFVIIYLSMRIIKYFYSDQKSYDFLPVIILLMAFLIHWYYVARTLSISMEEAAIRFFTGDSLTSTLIPSTAKFNLQSGLFGENIIFLVNHLPFGMMLFFIILGIGLVIKQKYQLYLAVFALLAFVSLPLWMPVSLNYLDIFRQFTFSRLLLFTSPFIMLIFAYALYNMLIYRFGPPVKLIFVLFTIFFVLYSFTLLINITNYDYRFKSADTQYTSYFNNEDLSSITFIESKTDNGAHIISDVMPFSYFQAKVYFIGIRDYGLRYYNASLLSTSGSGDWSKSYTLYRKGEFIKTNLLMVKPNYLNYEEHTVLENTFINSNKIYSTRNNEIFVSQ